jgi:D-alanyl-D-alanine carboxypeptidase (penicillin-binding protein 5/6)
VAGVVAAGVGSDSFSPSFFRPALRSLPPKLEVATAACKTGVVADWRARTLLWAKAETRAVPIASLTKMMTILVVVQDLEGRTDLGLDTPVAVTSEAAKVGGRQVWLDPRETFPLQDILRAALIHSANDAAFLLAQRLAGSEEAFVKRMQERAAALGLTSFSLNNAHGLPEGPTQRENLGSAIELAYLAGRLLGYPKVVEWSSTRLSYLEPRVDGKKTQLVNTNHLVSKVAGVNGMKTGFTDKSGYCLATTCERQGRQMVVIVTGCSRGSERDQLVTDLLEWAYSAP